MFNRATITWVGSAILAGFGLVVLSIPFAKADYGPKVTIGNNYQQWSNTMSINGIDAGNCTSTSLCMVLFQRAPQQKALIIQHVSCYMVVGGEPQVVRLLARKGRTLQQTRTSLLPALTNSGRWIVNSPVMHLIGSNHLPIVAFQNSLSVNWGIVECTISGQLKNP